MLPLCCWFDNYCKCPFSIRIWFLTKIWHLLFNFMEAQDNNSLLVSGSIREREREIKKLRCRLNRERPNVYFSPLRHRVKEEEKRIFAHLANRTGR